MKGDCTLKSIRIKNVRSLKDTKTVNLPAVTLLVGENSSGKSTFLRTFPLIKQSISKRTDGPLLWAGDVDDYVDFGSFRETVTSGEPNEISFEFGFPFSFDLNQEILWFGDEYEYIYSHSTSIDLNRNNEVQFDVRYALTIVQSDNKDEYVSTFRVQINNDTTIEFSFSPTQSATTIRVDGITYPIPEATDKQSRMYYRNSGQMNSIFGFQLPNISVLQEELLNYFETIRSKESEFRAGSETRTHNWYQETRTIIRYMGALLCQFGSFQAIEHQIKISSANKTQRESNLHFGELFESACGKMKIKELSERELSKITPLLKLSFFYQCYLSMDKFIDTYFRQVHYIAPLRATAERYYRLRNLAIDDVDYQGKNLAVFLNGLSKSQLKNFQQWTQEHFGFQVLIKPSGGHLSVNISLNEGKGSINLSDTGFGYSQILPIIVQLWYLSTKKRRSTKQNIPLVIAIEQPELHLHPAMQAKLTRAFIAAIRLAEQQGYRLQLLLETHSQTIVNYFGSAIVHGGLRREDISVVLFEKSPETGQTDVKFSQYDGDGYLQNWPIGFFAPEEW